MAKLKTVIALIITIIALVVTVSFYVSQSIQREKSIEKVNLVFMDVTWSNAVLWAVENKLVAFPENVEIQVLPLTSSNDMFVTGRADIGAVTVSPFLQAWNLNKDWRIITPYGASHNYFCVAKDSNITSPYDLKGKKIAVTELRAIYTLVLLDILEKKYNISQNEVTLIPKPMPVIPALIEGKDVDAGVVIGRAIPDAPKKFKVLFEIEKEYESIYGYPSIPVVIAAKKDLDKKIVKNITSTLDKALEIAYDDIGNLSKWYYEKHGKNKTEEFIADKNDIKYFIVVPWDENKKAVLQQEFELSKKYGIVEEIPNIEDIIMEV